MDYDFTVLPNKLFCRVDRQRRARPRERARARATASIYGNGAACTGREPYKFSAPLGLTWVWSLRDPNLWGHRRYTTSPLAFSGWCCAPTFGHETQRLFRKEGPPWKKRVASEPRPTGMLTHSVGCGPYGTPRPLLATCRLLHTVATSPGRGVGPEGKGSSMECVGCRMPQSTPQKRCARRLL